MKATTVGLLVACASLMFPTGSTALPTDGELQRALGEAKKQGGGLVTLERLSLGPDRSPIALARLGSGDPHAPAVLIVAGLDGRHAVGSKMALAVLTRLASDRDETSRLLNGGTLYVIPRVQGGERSGLDAERGGLPGEGDHDRDGLIGEDDVDDLNRDGRITLVRVRDPKGAYLLDGSADEFLRKADPQKGERGEWLVLSEGRDDDGDRSFNEEADGGVIVGRTFTHGYEWFARDTGAHQVSTAEARAVADFIAAHPELSAVLVFGFEDNLLTPLADKTSDPPLRGSRFGRKPVDDINRHDLPHFSRLAESYRETLGLKKDAKGLGSGGPGLTLAEAGPSGPTTAAHAAKGGLGQFVYFTRGRLALATPVWTPRLQLALNDAADDGELDAGANDDDPENEGGEEAEETPAKKVDKEVQAEERYRDWRRTLDPEGWLPWEPLKHPDFPGQEAWVGGFAPHAKINPPPESLGNLEAAHTDFVRDVLADLARVRLREAELTPRGAGVHELRVVVENIGVLPDVLAQGVFSTHVRDTRVEVELPPGGEVLGGPPWIKLDRLEGGGWQEVRFTLRLPSGAGSVKVEAISETAGRDGLTLRPGERREGN